MYMARVLNSNPKLSFQRWEKNLVFAAIALVYKTTAIVVIKL